VRLVGIALGELGSGGDQLDLFPSPTHEKWERIMHSVDTLRTRIGFSAVQLGRDKKP
jgi:hypothetical protein